MTSRPDRPRPAPGEPPGCPQRGPFVVTCPPGRYALCRCRRSTRYPYCDGSHRTLEGIGPFKVDLDAETRIAWCACGHSGNAPFCDGTHATLPEP